MYEDILSKTEYRDSPLPKGPWVFSQQWDHTLFMHHSVDKEALLPFIPAGLELDTFEGEAWISIIPFRVSGMHFRMIPKIPYLHTFLELNVRTYVKRNGVPGICFFSLDAEKLLDVLGARATTLPYYYASMNMTRKGDTFHYYSKRKGKSGALLQGTWRPVSAGYSPEKGSVANWLVERYYLWTPVNDSLYSIGVHHLPWKIHDASGHFETYNLSPLPPSAFSGGKFLLHYAEARRVLFWPMKKS
ncbi:YqjF family protein [Halobacillus sp. Marseille-Q1614]|uniref:YqjF family protein n=1 Tax=Halobacillus sp. Marseille-Q1614 TaxID=2709134 RepID=UPI00156F6E08|nr:DUF2071 domain-containing protein [Halobacillus sp. Marseille-Q1614]